MQSIRPHPQFYKLALLLTPSKSSRSSVSSLGVICSNRQFSHSISAVSPSSLITATMSKTFRHHSQKNKTSQRSAASITSSIADTVLGKDLEAAALLDGLDVYTVPSLVDDHPLTVYGIQSTISHQNDIHQDVACTRRRPILLLHGRTWSSVPVYHLLGGPKQREKKGEESRSLMEAFFDTHELQPYCLDFRGFGGTPPDETYQVTPHTCVADVESVLQWISSRHGLQYSDTSSSEDDDDDGLLQVRSKKKTCDKCEMPILLGWSQGALVAHLVAQKTPSLLSKLVLYGSIYDPLVRYPRAPLYTQPSTDSSSTGKTTGTATIITKNTYYGAIEDFTIEGSIPPDPARQFAQAALLCDPNKVQWSSLHEFNNADPARVHVPTLVVAGDQDPYSPLRAQQELFCNLGRGADRCWSILSGSDHAIHLLNARTRFVQIVKNFAENGRRNKRDSSF